MLALALSSHNKAVLLAGACCYYAVVSGLRHLAQTDICSVDKVAAHTLSQDQD